jgi:hypothetical protein
MATPDFIGKFTANNPGIDTPYWVEGTQFKKGQVVTFKYRELSDDGIPKEARYWRRRKSAAVAMVAAETRSD